MPNMNACSLCRLAAVQVTTGHAMSRPASACCQMGTHRYLYATLDPEGGAAQEHEEQQLKQESPDWSVVSRTAVLADAEGLLTCYGVGEESTGQLTHAVIELCFTSSVRFLQPGLLLQACSLLPWHSRRHKAHSQAIAENPVDRRILRGASGGPDAPCRAWAQGKQWTPSAGRSPGSRGRCASGRSAPLSRRA